MFLAITPNKFDEKFFVWCFFEGFGKMRRKRRRTANFHSFQFKITQSQQSNQIRMSENIQKAKSPLPLDGQKRQTAPLSADVGGTMTKIVCWLPENSVGLPQFVISEEESMDNLHIYPDPILKVTRNQKGENKLAFIKFQSSQVPEFISHAKKSGLKEIYGIGNLQTLNVTGGGAFKYKDMLMDELQLQIKPQDEMRSLVLGINFLQLCCKEEICFKYENRTKVYQQIPEDDVFPFIVMNIGSGVSCLKVTGPESYQRVTGSLVGGGVFWGLMCLLTNYKSFDEMLEAARNGNHESIDLFVKDIYGRNYDSVGLSGDLMAACFGKVQKVGSGQAKEMYAEEDIANALMMMVCSSCAHVSYIQMLHHKCKRIFFTGGFVSHNPAAWECISSTLHDWSGNQFDAHFLEYDGYFGALGALLLSEFEKEK